VLPAPAAFPSLPLGGGPPPAAVPPGQAYPPLPGINVASAFGDLRGTAGPEQIVRAMGGVGNAARREPCPTWIGPDDSHTGHNRVTYEDWRRFFMHWYTGERFLQSPIQMLTRALVNAMTGKVKEILLNLGDDALFSAGIPGDPNNPNGLEICLRAMDKLYRKTDNTLAKAAMKKYNNCFRKKNQSMRAFLYEFEQVRNKAGILAGFTISENILGMEIIKRSKITSEQESLVMSQVEDGDFTQVERICDRLRYLFPFETDESQDAQSYLVSYP
jgi:hypothetical protein